MPGDRGGGAEAYGTRKELDQRVLEPVFELWRREHATATTYLVTGDCTDICVLQFVLSAKAWHNTRNLPLRILVPTALTDTFDAPGHRPTRWGRQRCI